MKSNAGKLKAFNSLSSCYSEFRMYRRDQDGRVVKERDHLMDPMRYLNMSGRDRMRTKPHKEIEHANAKNRAAKKLRRENPDPGFQTKVVLWSYPIIKDGLIYVIDVRNGLFVLRYSGPNAADVQAVKFS